MGDKFRTMRNEEDVKKIDSVINLMAEYITAALDKYKLNSTGVVVYIAHRLFTAALNVMASHGYSKGEIAAVIERYNGTESYSYFKPTDTPDKLNFDTLRLVKDDE